MRDHGKRPYSQVLLSAGSGRSDSVQVRKWVLSTCAKVVFNGMFKQRLWYFRKSERPPVWQGIHALFQSSPKGSTSCASSVAVCPASSSEGTGSSSVGSAGSTLKAFAAASATLKANTDSDRLRHLAQRQG